MTMLSTRISCESIWEEGKPDAGLVEQTRTGWLHRYSSLFRMIQSCDSIDSS